jgi:cytochrome c oxidase subunit 4
MSDQEQQVQEHSHPGTGTYLAVFGVLTVITLVEVGVFYVPAFASILAPLLIVLSSTKFALVVMFYMHLKHDHSLFRGVFIVPLLIALGVVTALLLLFGVF